LRTLLEDRRLGGWALIVGAALFTLFWSTSLFGADLPVVLALAIHGISSALLSLGLVSVQWGVRGRSKVIAAGWVGVVAAVAGVATSLPLFAAGVAVYAVAAGLRDRRWTRATALVVGAIGLVGAFLQGARFGLENAPEPSDTAAFAFGVGLAMLLIGFLLTGVARLHGNRHEATASNAAGA
jgi:hypothetical protein